MAKADSIDTTRRRMLTGGAALAAVPFSLSTDAAASGRDPIFALIERHRCLWRELDKALGATSRAQEAQRDGEGRLRPDDHPAVAPYRAADEQASNAVYECEAVLAQTVPTSAAGLAAVISYAREYDRENGAPLFHPADEIVDAGRSLDSWLASLEAAARNLATT
jgi:hypothetical protein